MGGVRGEGDEWVDGWVYLTPLGVRVHPTPDERLAYRTANLFLSLFDMLLLWRGLVPTLRCAFASLGGRFLP